LPSIWEPLAADFDQDKAITFANVQRGHSDGFLLDSTLIVWGGEIGRLPIAQLPADKDKRKAGRDHNKNAFCTWMAGGGIKGGTTYGATDELGLNAVEEWTLSKLEILEYLDWLGSVRDFW
jgi:hypothetical protein